MSEAVPSVLGQVSGGGSTGTTTSTQTGYAYTRPFVQPAPVWDYWYLMLVPLVLGVSVVYKTVKCGRAREIPLAALGMAMWIIVAFVGAAVGLLVLVRVVR